ncbi:hypothetical protein A2765_03485 [Candidatus Kaiserbacteria bacterium RIFCSPHIGHO2_01_FULL_56_24]|uniref:DUF5671 domain-containing protein n=1 Tax=Candidatus Kaiserbacteria bacterium RIFCSPHIGHO2_01_FULL_56_24 TaxID=1798487 RepID=A0A1F6DGR5_9BACT|nr:MAG: hypothetical protein A2765_03485 [Candidatus Kaiserbacteria bacterium RIFCSPHIGHO2_01_FULL_56_24]
MNEKTLSKFTSIVAVLAIIVVFGLVLAQTYVRWSVNQNFTFLGGNELEALTLSAFALLIGLAYIHRSR